MKAFAVKNKNTTTRLRSRSGGVFPALSDFILNQNGSVYGCILNSKLEAVHTQALNKPERDEMCGSKYVQSCKSDMFKLVKSDLKSGKHVLFSGTPCEIDGLKSYLSHTDKSRLVLIDIVCHGVPSPLLWKKYLNFVECKTGQKVIKADFRNKKDFGWASNIETLYLSDGTTYNSRDYASIYYSHYPLRPSCSRCPYKSLQRCADITLADCWGIDKYQPEFNDNKGVSLILINTSKGNEIFQSVVSQFDAIEVDIKNFLQAPLDHSFKVNKHKRELFWKKLHEKSFTYIVAKYGANSLEEKIKRSLHKLLPESIVRQLKKLLGR